MRNRWRNCGLWVPTDRNYRKPGLLYPSNIAIQKAWLPVIRAQLAMNRKQYEESLAQLRVVGPYRSELPEARPSVSLEYRDSEGLASGNSRAIGHEQETI